MRDFIKAIALMIIGVLKSPERDKRKSERLLKHVITNMQMSSKLKPEDMSALARGHVGTNHDIGNDQRSASERIDALGERLPIHEKSSIQKMVTKVNEVAEFVGTCESVNQGLYLTMATFRPEMRL